MSVTFFRGIIETLWLIQPSKSTIRRSVATTRVCRHSIHCHAAQPRTPSQTSQTHFRAGTAASLTDRSIQRTSRVASRSSSAGLRSTIPWYRISATGFSPPSRYRRRPLCSTGWFIALPGEEGVEEPTDVAHAVHDDVPRGADHRGSVRRGREDGVQQEDRDQPEDDLLDRWRAPACRSP